MLMFLSLTESYLASFALIVRPRMTTARRFHSFNGNSRQLNCGEACVHVSFVSLFVYCLSIVECSFS